MFLLRREIIFRSRYSIFYIFIYPMIYQIFDVIVVISTGDRGHFSVSHPGGIWEHGFHLGVLSGTANITL